MKDGFFDEVKKAAGEWEGVTADRFAKACILQVAQLVYGESEKRLRERAADAFGDDKRLTWPIFEAAYPDCPLCFRTLERHKLPPRDQLLGAFLGKSAKLAWLLDGFLEHQPDAGNRPLVLIVPTRGMPLGFAFHDSAAPYVRGGVLAYHDPASPAGVPELFWCEPFLEMLRAYAVRD